MSSAECNTREPREYSFGRAWKPNVRTTMRVAQPILRPPAQNRDRAPGLFVGLALVVSSVQLSIPGVPFATTNRLAIGVMIVALLFRIARNPATPVAFARRFVPLLAGLAACVIWGGLSTYFSPYPGAVSLAYVMSWLLVGVVTLLFGVAATGLSTGSKALLLDVVVIGAFVITFSTFIFLASDIGLSGFTDPLRVRRAFVQLGPGLNRHMVGLFSVNAICVSVVLGIVKRRVALLSIAAISLAMFIVLVVLSGSRQTLVAMVAYIPLVWFAFRRLSSTRMRVGSSTFRTAGRVLFGLAVLVFALRGLRDNLGYDLGTWMQDRFFKATVDEYDGSHARVRILRDAFQTIGKYPVWGVGSGAFLHEHDLLPHNGHVRLASEFGLPAAGCILFGIVFTIGSALRSRETAFTSGRADLFATSLALVTVYYFIGNLFNDLVNDYTLWGHAILLAASCQRPREAGDLSVHPSEVCESSNSGQVR